MIDRIPLVLLPGLLNDAELWSHQARHLAEAADVRVADLTQADAIASLARQVLEEAPPRFALAGLSMGGYVALEIMRQAPERVAKLALLDTNAHGDSPEQTERRRALMALAEEGRLDEVAARLMPNLIHPDRLNDPDLTGRILAMARRVGPDAFLRQQTAIINRKDSREDLAGIRCPTLVLCGRQDALSGPESHAGMAAAIPGARLAIIEDCGHLSTMERPQAVTVMMRDWLIHA